MSRSTELFAVAATVFLLIGLVLRFFVRTNFLAVGLPGTHYAMGTPTACVLVGSFLCIFAAAYSLWMVPLNGRAGLWHFWLTIGAIAIYWTGMLSLIMKQENLPRGDLHGMPLALAIVWLGSIPLLIIAQGIFFFNLIFALRTMWKVR